MMSHPIALVSGILPDTSQRPRGLGWIPPCALMAIAALPVVSWFIKRLDDGSDEPLGLLVLAFALLLAWRDRHSVKPSARAMTLGALLILTSVLGIGSVPPMLRATLAIGGIGLWFGFHHKPGLMGMLMLSLPVVASLQFYAGYPMRLAAAEGSVRILELTGLVVARNGVNLELGGTLIGVDPACSGIRMLWHSLVAAMALAAIHRVSWRSAVIGGLLAIMLVIPANVLRATWLALEESRRINDSGLSHGNIGLVGFSLVLIPLWIVFSKQARPSTPVFQDAVPGRIHRIILLVSAILAPFLMLRAGEEKNVPMILSPPETFTFNGLTLPLHPMPQSPEERAFAKSFPGSLSSHQWGDKQVILRRVTQATRSLHPSRDCLRAAGFATSDSVTVRSLDGDEWSRFSATSAETRLIIHERIVSEQDGNTWTDVPAWYWSALRHPLNGPWRAETVISR